MRVCLSRIRTVTARLAGFVSAGHPPAVRVLRVIQQRTVAICDRVRAAVASELELGDVVAATRRAHRELDAEAARAIARESEAPACSAGCSHCCHVHAEATHAEVLAIARHLSDTRSASEVDAVAARLAEQVRVVGAMTYDERWSAKVPCALLAEDGRCSIYEVRPLRCRAFHSFSLDACRDAFAGDADVEPVTSRALDRACDAAERGFELALEAHGHSAEPVLLEAALLDALSSGTRSNTPRT